MSDSQSVSALSLRGGSLDIGKAFWQQWQQYRDYLYHCCIKWMGGNPTDAEDALSRAMLKAWEKVQKYAGEIDNFKSWLSTLTHNLCVDIHRERSRGANRVLKSATPSREPPLSKTVRETFASHGSSVTRCLSLIPHYQHILYPEKFWL